MKLVNLHTHTRHSDGSDEPVKYIEEALRQGFETLGFSDHSPVPFPNNFAIKNEGPALDDYCQSILVLKKNYSSGSDPLGHLDILLGLELDYIPGITFPGRFYREKYPIGYIIGSVHLVKNEEGKLWFIDGPKREIYDQGLKELFGSDIRKAVTTYFRQEQEMIQNERPDIIGHMDKIKMHNQGRFFSEDEPWYTVLVDETLSLVKDAGSVVEVNTRGIYKKRSDSLFPGPEILKKLYNMKVPVCLTSDAHRPEELSLYFKDAREILKSVGYRTQLNLKKNAWEEIPL